ncbi:hypothetical protein CPC08DRAFT_715065 [Agrocybe pediades]|nr:hypothetical protein CPC08DRAFT_715065 [Agrocybe pediades]
MMYILLMGFYVAVYFGTVYVYFEYRQASKNKGVLWTISFLFVSCLGQLGSNWYYTRFVFVDQGDTRASIFVNSYRSPSPLVMISATLAYVSSILADGLLLWRCFHITNRSLRWIVLPAFLFVCEIALDLTSFVFNTGLLFQRSFATDENRRKFNVLDACFNCVAAATSLVATSIIAYRIISTTRSIQIPNGNVHHTKKWSYGGRYKHVVDIVLQSAMIYSATLVAMAIIEFVPVSADNFVQMNSVVIYFEGLSSIVTGLAPTIMVARVALSTGKTADETSSSGPHISRISALQFDRRHDTTTDHVSQSNLPSTASSDVLPIGAHDGASEKEFEV